MRLPKPLWLGMWSLLQNWWLDNRNVFLFRRQLSKRKVYPTKSIRLIHANYNTIFLDNFKVITIIYFWLIRFHLQLYRCDKFDPSDIFSRPPEVDDEYCYERFDGPGTAERFCEVICQSDGSCTETVKQRTCSCVDHADPDSEAEPNCATLEYKVCIQSG